MADNRQRIILVVSNDLSCDARVHKMATTLMNTGYSVLVLGRKLPQSLPLSEMPYEQRRLRFLCNRGALFYAEMNIRFFFFLLFRKFELATANDLDTLLAVYCATKIRRKAIVYDSHEYFTEVPELQQRPRVKKIWLSLERRIFPKLRYTMTVCKSIAKAYQQTYHTNVEVVRNVPFLQATQAIPANLQLPSKHVVLYQGALNLGRGLEMLIESMQFLTDVCLLLVGDGDKAMELKQLAKEKAVSEKVIFIGKIPFENLPSYTQLATIGVSVEEDTGYNYRYALPNKLFDYIHAGKPVLVSDLPEMKNIVETYRCGEVLQNRTPELVARQIQTLLQNTSQLQFYAEQSRKASQELCWQREEEKILQLYRNSLNFN